MTMSRSLRHREIEQSELFVTVMPPEGMGPEGLGDLACAHEIGKPILVWRPEGRGGDVPFPVVYVDGDEDAALHAVREYFEDADCEFTVIDGAYDEG